MLRRKNINAIALAFLLLWIILSFLFPISWWFLAVLAVLWFLVTLCGSFLIQWNYHCPSVHANKKTAEPIVSLTFDDGPDPEFTPKVLGLLKQYNAKATFFCIGKNIEAHPEIFKHIIADGHTIGNHTYSHSKAFGFYGTEKVVRELQRANALVLEKTGLRMNLYRPAFGVTNPSIEKAIKKLKLNSVGWNVRSLDTTPRTADMVLRRITSKISKGDVVLLHDTSEKTIRVLERLLLFLKEKNLQSVPVDQLLQLKAYV